MILYRVHVGTQCLPSGLIMIAPLSTIVRAFKLAPEAKARIVDETPSDDRICTLHFNGKFFDVSANAEEVTIIIDAQGLKS